MKKVLIVTYYWPPSGGGGVQRWLKSAKYLPEYGWEPIIYTPKNPQFDQLDYTLEKQIDPNLRVIKKSIWEPYALLNKLKQGGRKQGIIKFNQNNSLKDKFIIWVRGNLFIPDPRAFWILPSIRYLIQIMRKDPIDLIITTGPPHSMHLIGYGIKKALGSKISWIADFRDPWSDWDMLDKLATSKWIKKLHRKLESIVLDSSDGVLTVSEKWSKDLQFKTETEVFTLTNGFDEDDFDTEESDRSNEYFEIVHFGLLNDFRSSPELWQALNSVVEEQQKISFKLRLGGIVSDKVRSIILSYPALAHVTTFEDYVPHDQVLTQYKRASLLLLLANNSKNNSGHLPGKFFEYIAADKPILAISDGSSELSQIIKEHNFGLCASYQDYHEIKKALSRFLMADFTEGRKNTSYIFGRKYLTKHLAEIMDAMFASK